MFAVFEKLFHNLLVSTNIARFQTLPIPYYYCVTNGTVLMLSYTRQIWWTLVKHHFESNMGATKVTKQLRSHLHKRKRSAV